MSFLVQGGSSTATNPVLDLYTSFDSVLTDIYSLSFQVYDVTSDAKRAIFFSNNPAPVQVFPVTPGTYYNLDASHLTTDVTAGHKLSAGHYYAPWTAPADAPLGNYIISWYYKRTSVSQQKTYQEEFVVVDANLSMIGSVSGVSGGSISGFIAQLQMYMWDYFNSNQLLDAVEYSVQQYELAVNLSLMRFNATSPLTGYQLQNFPPGALYIIFMGGAGHLLRMTSILQLRNQLTYMDGNIHVGITDKHALYIQAGQQHLQDFDQMARGAKNNLNNDDGWDTISSPYSALLGGWGNSGFGWGWG